MIKIRAPRAFTLHGRRWTVVGKKRLKVRGRAAHGVTYKCEGRIELAAQPPPPEGYFNVFCHELIHAALPVGLLDSDTEEHVADVLAAALPDIVRALVEEG